VFKIKLSSLVQITVVAINQTLFEKIERPGSSQIVIQFSNKKLAIDGFHHFHSLVKNSSKKLFPQYSWFVYILLFIFLVSVHKFISFL